MNDDLDTGLAEVAAALTDADGLIRVVAGGRRRGQDDPEPAHLRGRVVALKAGPALQLVGTTGPRVSTHNLPYGSPGFDTSLAEVLARPYGSWRVETTTRTLQVRFTKRGKVLVHDGPALSAQAPPQQHDRARQRLIDPDDPLFSVLGADGAKRRQVDAFLRSLAATLDRGQKRHVLPDGPLRVVDLGCGNAYLTMAAHRYLTGRRPGTTTIGVEVRTDLVDRSRDRAVRAGLTGLEFVPGTIADVNLGASGVDVVLALHACDTATDEALARADGWQAPVVLAAPCCHHDVQTQLGGTYPDGHRALLASPILRERFADVLTDTLRASVLRGRGYRVDVVEFVESTHTPRNVLLRAVRTGEPPTAAQTRELDELCAAWGVHPALARMLKADGQRPGGSDNDQRFSTT